MVARTVRTVLCGLAWLGPALALVPTPARGQLPEPRVPDVTQRSGLISRFVPIRPWLPEDPDRDTFYDTRWADRPDSAHPNSPCNGGLYGYGWKGDCTACTYPYFRGAPGQSTLDADCAPHGPWSRWWQNFVHPFKPVCVYYAGGCYVPVYDLDPWVTGPGPFPLSLFKKPHDGG
jgi:hypothetical protein